MYKKATHTPRSGNIRYDRNKYTQYYIVYNVDGSGNIFIERITTNHVTLF